MLPAISSSSSAATPQSFTVRERDGSTLLNANSIGDDALGATIGHPIDDHRMTIDFLMGIGTWEVSRLADDGLHSTVACL